MIQTESGKLYTGITTDLERRFEEHSGKPSGAKFFATSGPERIVFRESHESRSAASKREWEIKRLSRQQKLNLLRENS